MSEMTRMFVEAAQAPDVVLRQLATNAVGIRQLGAALRRFAPRAVVTCARGSSDHAATFAKYVIEAHAQVLTSSASPSVSSIYDAMPDLEGVLFLAISQSGRSPDLLAATERAKSCRALVVVLCNDPDAPLSALADHVVPLCAGAESSVAATKSYIASLSAIVDLVASWTGERKLREALVQAPEQLAAAWQLDWSAGLRHLQDAAGLFVIGRGFGLGIAQEAALKLKETCALHAEAFSAAEVQHGPMALVRAGFRALMFSQSDDTREGMQALAKTFIEKGATVLLAGARASGAVTLPTLPSHPVIEPLLTIQSFYRMANALALARRCDPDAPPHLRKVTETV
jgi:glucosamine--fructose-6-phosphate aminotransferase (isomerizing)